MKRLILFFTIPIIAGAEFVEEPTSLPDVMAGVVSSADYNSDGWSDIAVSGLIFSGYTQTHTTKLYLGTQTGFIESQTLPALTGSAIDWADIDADSELDLAIAGYGDTPFCAIYKNNNGVFTKHQELAGVGAASIGFCDIDSDGDQDLVITGSSTSGPITKVFQNIEANFSEAQSLTGVYRGAILWIDYDSDSDLDLLVSGDTGSGYITKLYRNDGGVFVETDMALPGVRVSSLASADYDADSDPDLVISGDRGDSVILQVYRNDDGNFTLSQELSGIDWSSLSLFDIDSDGDCDLIASGRRDGLLSTNIYLNSSGNFTEQDSDLVDLFESSITFADFDRDNDPDLVLSGYRGPDAETKLYLNTGPANTSPSPPTSLSFSYTKPVLTLSWNQGGDSKTLPSGLYYNIRVGTEPGSQNTVSALHSNTKFGAQYGLQNRIFKIKNLAPGRYYWAVQAIDAGLSKSSWSAEQEITIPSVNPEITLLSPTSGLVGELITIEASNFLAGEDIAIHFSSDLTVATTATNQNGTFSVTFLISTHKAGTHTITVESPSGLATTHFFIIPGPLARIEVEPTSAVIVLGASKTFTAKGFDVWDNLLTLTYNWSLSEPLGTISPTTGTSTIFIAGTSPGFLVLTASTSTVTGTATISVSKTRLYLFPEEIVTGSGYEIEVGILLDDVEELVGADIFLKFDPEYLEPVQIEQGGFPEEQYVLVSAVEDGTVCYSFILLGSPASGSGTVATFTLRAEQDGSTTIQFLFLSSANRNTRLLNKDGDPIPFLYNSASIMIYSYATLTGVARLDISHKGDDHSGALVLLASPETKTTTDKEGRFILREVIPGTHTLWINMPGASLASTTVHLLPAETKDVGTSTLLNADADGNGGVNISDFYFLRTAYLSDSSHSDWHNSSDLSRNGLINADFDGNSKVNIDDAYILRENFGKIADTGFRGRRRVFRAEGAESGLSISPSQISAHRDERFTCKVIAHNLRELVGLEFHLNFDPELLSVVDIEDGELLKDGFLLTKKYDNEKGFIDYAIGLLQGTVSGSGVVAYITFCSKKQGFSKVEFVSDPSSNRQTTLLDSEGEDIPAEIEDGEVIVPLVSSIRDSFAYPNPRRFGDVTFAVPSNTLIELRIYNIAGELIYHKEERSTPDGKLIWKVVSQEGEDVASGVYIFRLKNKEKNQERIGKIGIIK